jgi:hypothetical protein
VNDIYIEKLYAAKEEEEKKKLPSNISSVKDNSPINKSHKGKSLMSKSPKEEKKSTKAAIDVVEQDLGIGKPIVVKRDILKNKVEEKKPVIASKRPVEVPKEVENTKHTGKLKPIVNPPKISNVKRVSKENIKVFEEDDESDFERHFTHSRAKVRDPMESSDVSSPPTPIVVSAKVPICTDGSIQLSEQAVKDANNYVKNLYQSSSVNNAYNARDSQPYNYGNSKVFAEGIPT